MKPNATVNGFPTTGLPSNQEVQLRFSYSEGGFKIGTKLTVDIMCTFDDGSTVIHRYLAVATAP